MHKGCMESTIVICLLGIVMSAAPALSQDIEGIYGYCYRVTESGKEPADSSTVYLVRLDNNTTYVDVTGDDWPDLGLHVARFADYTPPGTEVPSDNRHPRDADMVSRPVRAAERRHLRCL